VSSFKDELLRLLREDEGFRIEVMRLLGIINVNASLNQLIESVNKLTKSIEDLREEVRKLWEENHRIWEEIRRLREENQKIWEEIKKLREDVNKLWEENHRMWEEMQKMREDIRELREENHKIWENIQKIWEEIRKLREENQKIWEEIRELRKNHEDLARTVRGISRDLGGLSRTVGKLVEQDIRHYLPGWVRERYGITVDRIRRLRLDGEAEFDGFVETEDKVLLIEIKTTLRSRDIRDLARKVDRYRERAPGGKLIIPIVAYSMEGESLGRLLNAAKAYGITLVKHHGEYEFEEVSQ
jgi:chromosome segregation ATPase